VCAKDRGEAAGSGAITGFDRHIAAASRIPDLASLSSTMAESRAIAVSPPECAGQKPNRSNADRTARATY